MPRLNTSILLQAALGGGANYMQGRGIRKEKQTALEKELREEERRNTLDARNEELRKSQLEENQAQTKSALVLATQRQAPEQKEFEARSAYYDQQIAAGRSPEEAATAVRRRFGLTEAREQGPARGTPEYLEAVRQEAEIRGKTAAKYRRPLQGRAQGESGSEKDARDRREFMQSIIASEVKGGATR
jgi:hypothetical protein